MERNAAVHIRRFRDVTDDSHGLVSVIVSVFLATGLSEYRRV